MHCPVCGGNQSLKEVREYGPEDEVDRECISCHKVWVFSYHEGKLISLSEKDPPNKVVYRDSGFITTCPESTCGAEISTYTMFRPAWWKCQRCEKRLIRSDVSPIGDYQVPESPSLSPSGPSAAYRKVRKGRIGGGQPKEKREPRAHRPAPEGAYTATSLAIALNMEPRKLRAWLRRSNWRGGDEQGSQWLLSPEEAQEIAGRLGKTL